MKLNLQKAANVKTTATQRKAKIQVGSDIKLTQEQHDKLLAHCVDRLELSKNIRDNYIELFEFIDKEYNSYLLRDAEDKQREKDNLQGKGVKPTDEKLSMLFSQIDEALTYLLTLLAPDEAIYSAIAPKDQQKIADGFAKLMNEHAEYFGHYRNLGLFLLCTLKYNFGGFGVHWREVEGNVLQDDAVTGDITSVPQIVQQGNELLAYNPYNLFIDNSISPVDLPRLGEYYGYVELHTPFRLRMMENVGELYNIKSFLEKPAGQFHWYAHMPETRTSLVNNSKITDWVGVFTQTYGHVESAQMHEIVPSFFWLVPKQFGLSESENYEIWRIILGSDSHILSAKHMENAHGLLPIAVAMPYEDFFGWQTRGAAERLIPHQRFGSYVLNTHQRTVRKKLYGLTVYDENIIPLMKSAEVDLAGGKIPANTQGQDIDLRKKIVQFTDGPDTTRTLENIKIMHDMMQDILPTNMQQQVAGLERATQYQAAALVQSANRRNLKIAKIINSQAMDKARFMQMYNIFQYQKAVEILTESGDIIEVDPKKFRTTKIVFTISDGLKGLDKLSLIMHMKDIINTVVQSQQASSQADIMALIDYWSTLIGDNTDFSQFKLQSQIDALPKDQRDLAFKLLQEFIAQQEQQQKQQQTAGNT